jgi:hypothetical protein
MGRTSERAPESAQGLDCATTAELMTELKRRCLGCMVVCVRAEEQGDAWFYELKGSPILLGAMNAALSLKIGERLTAERR